MNALVVYESLTGNTQIAADMIAAELTSAGVGAEACPITGIDYQALSDADLVVIGSWTDGLVLFGQRPGRAQRLAKFPRIDGKKAALYCTYAINAGQTLKKMERIVTARGGDVIGGVAINRRNLSGGSADFVDRLLSAL